MYFTVCHNIIMVRVINLVNQIRRIAANFLERGVGLLNLANVSRTNKKNMKIQKALKCLWGLLEPFNG